MTIYVGKWDLLPDYLEGYNGLSVMNRDDVTAELSREIDLYAEDHDAEDNRMGVYTPEEFEDEFNQTLKNHFTSEHYWIRIFAD